MSVTSIQNKMDERDAKKYRLLQAAAMLELFRMDFGRAPASMHEFEAWAVNQRFRSPIDPYAVLTHDQITETLRNEAA